MTIDFNESRKVIFEYKSRISIQERIDWQQKRDYQDNNDNNDIMCHIIYCSIGRADSPME